MSGKNYSAIVVEGEDREITVINNLMKHCLKKDEYKIISLPVGQNIYMLWKKMKEDNFDTDIIELIKESNEQAKHILTGIERNDIADIILLFDYDGHQNNLPESVNGEDVLKEMLETFDNETEYGKLYISYPMVESVRDFIPLQCSAFTSCEWQIKDLTKYKTKTGVTNCNAEIKKYDFIIWQEIINIFVLRISCLFKRDEMISFEDYRKEITPLTIYNKQQEYIVDGKVFVLSAFPEFVLDWFKIDFWKKCVKRQLLYKDETCIYKK